jgi:hypothetical protein
MVGIVTYLRQRWLVWKDDRKHRGFVNSIVLETRADVTRLMTMKDEEGFPLLWAKYNKQSGMEFLFLGKPISWPESTNPAEEDQNTS